MVLPQFNGKMDEILFEIAYLKVGLQEFDVLNKIRT